jgi:hypothetical protein
MPPDSPTACLDRDLYMYLIADPCCPWLSPWAPPKAP